MTSIPSPEDLWYNSPMTIKTYLEGSLLLDAFFGYDEESSSETQAMFTGCTLTETQASCTAEVSIVPTVAKLSNSSETMVRAASMPVLGMQNEENLGLQSTPGTLTEPAIMDSAETPRPVSGPGSRRSSIDRWSEFSEAQETGTTRSTPPSDIESRTQDCAVENDSSSSSRGGKRKRSRRGKVAAAGTSLAEAILIDDSPRPERKKRKAAKKAQQTWQKHTNDDSLWMGEVWSIAGRMSEVNHDQTASLRSLANQIGVMQKGLSELARQVELMCEDKQREELANLQRYMAEWGAKDQAATRQLQH